MLKKEKQKRRFFIQISKHQNMYAPAGGGVVRVTPGVSCFILLSENKMQTLHSRLKIDADVEYYRLNPTLPIREDDLEIYYCAFDEKLPNCPNNSIVAPWRYNWHENYQTGTIISRASPACYLESKPLNLISEIEKKGRLCNYTSRDFDNRVWHVIIEENDYFCYMCSKNSENFYNTELGTEISEDIALVNEINTIKQEIEKIFPEEIEYEYLHI